VPFEQVRLGLAEATRTVARYGLDHRTIVKLNFDPQAAKELVETAAVASDRY